VFTDCPTCRRQFRLNAQHLAAAAGEVRCGFCGTRFSALSRLHDAPLPDLVPASAQPVAEAAAPPPIRAPAPPPEAPGGPVEEPEFDIAFDVPGPAPGPSPAPLARSRPELAIAARVDATDGTGGDRGRWLWGMLSVLLLVAGTLQAAWFRRDDVLDWRPDLRPYVERLCARAGCEITRRRDLSAITVVNRDVRVHPRYEDALLVNATLRNGAPYAQPFPRIQLALSDTNGRVLAARSFAPEEYLDASIDRNRGMEPGAPVHVVLELAGADPGAVSFEIGFE
jgi:predicted Zn finger-like uncharacterized protein